MIRLFLFAFVNSANLLEFNIYGKSKDLAGTCKYLNVNKKICLNTESREKLWAFFYATNYHHSLC